MYQLIGSEELPDPADENIVESNKFCICIISLTSGKMHSEIYYDSQFKSKSLNALSFLSKDPMFYMYWKKSSHLAVEKA